MKENHPTCGNAVASEIVSSVSKVTGLSVASIMGFRRHKSVAYARIMSMGMVRDNTMMSYEEIGVYFHRDHTTVISNERQFEHLLSSDKTFAATYKAVADSLNGALIVRRDSSAGDGAKPLFPPPDPSAVICAVADAAELTLDEIMGSDKALEIVCGKRVAVVLLRELTPLSLTEIAKALCIPSHTTVISALKLHKSKPSRWSKEIEAKARKALEGKP